MRNIILDSFVCDRAMLTPQPTEWADNAKICINLLSCHGPWDLLTLRSKQYSEEVVTFLRDYPEYCPERICIRWLREPVLEAKIGIWIGEMTILET